MNKIAIAALVAAAGAVGFAAAKVIREKKKGSDNDLFGDGYDDGCCGCDCECGEEPDVLVPGDDAEDDNAEEVKISDEEDAPETSDETYAEAPVDTVEDSEENADL